MKRSWVRLPGCAISLAAAVAVFALAVYMLASCATFGDTTRQLDADGVRTVVKRWTGAALPESITVVTAQEDRSRDSSMYAVFDTATTDIDEFVGMLGARRLREFAPDCSAPAGRPVFTEIPGSEQVFDAGPQSWLVNMHGRYESEYEVIRPVENGTLERCRNIVTVFAKPTSPYVDMAIQKRGDGTSRVVLGVTYT